MEVVGCCFKKKNLFFPEHVESPDLTYLKVRAFRIEPDAAQQGLSYLDVDGGRFFCFFLYFRFLNLESIERMPSYGPVLSEMHRGLLNFIKI